MPQGSMRIKDWNALSCSHRETSSVYTGVANRIRRSLPSIFPPHRPVVNVGNASIPRLLAVPIKAVYLANAEGKVPLDSRGNLPRGRGSLPEKDGARCRKNDGETTRGSDRDRTRNRGRVHGRHSKETS